MQRFVGAMAFGAALIVCGVGCGEKAPPVYPITGKVTIGGKAYPRVICYFRPANEPVTQYTIGVTETDKDGNFPGIRNNAGTGLPAGEYKVTFSCTVVKSSGAALKEDDKPSELGVATIELVPDEYVEGKANETTVVRTTVKKQDGNEFVFDIPVKKSR